MGNTLSYKHQQIVAVNYHNYKGTFSIVLLAVIDAEYKFLYVDVGCNGRVSDGGNFDRCSLNHALETGTVELPLQYFYLGGHGQFRISLLQMMHLL